VQSLGEEFDLGDALPLAQRTHGSRLGGSLTMLFGALFATVALVVIGLMIVDPGSNAGHALSLILVTCIVNA